MRNSIRTTLHDVLPLRVPFTLMYSPVTVCNFRCGYCYHSISHAFPAGETRMPFDTYRKSIDDAAAFCAKVKLVQFAGFGEPLLHPRIADMVAQAKEKNVAETVEIVTNGALLDERTTHRLLDAGLDKLRISLQGLCEEDYRRVSGVAFPFPRFLENVRYFYERRGQCELRIKIMNIACRGEEGERRFHEMFDPITDAAYVENCVPLTPGRKSGFGTKNKTMQNDVPVETRVCPFPFYTLVIWPSGKVAPCCYFRPPVILGDLHRMSLREIWEGPVRLDFLRKSLEDRSGIPLCAACPQPVYDRREGDDLDPYRNELLTIF